MLHALRVPRQRAFDIVHGLPSPAVWHSFVEECGWSREEVQDLVRDLLGQLLLAPGRDPSPT